MSTYNITYSNGNKATAETQDEAEQIILAQYPDAYIESFDDRTLAWENEEESINDDGAKAVAEIRKAQTITLNEEHLGSEATKEEALALVEILNERGYPAEYGAASHSHLSQISDDEFFKLTNLAIERAAQKAE